ncbi:MAG: PHP domain-containing protein [Firmicutes bacterium]|nr:PHP domain-containing protein [Bacillota bacterium]
MRKYLIDPALSSFKANLHCHTVLSDGSKTPEEVKRDYIAHGYSAVAFTEHDKFIDHSDLTGDGFIALNGFELEYWTELWRGRTCHICFIAKDPENCGLGWSDPAPDLFKVRLKDGEKPFAEGGRLYRALPPQRLYTPEYINADIAAAKMLGFFVTYNHPSWSLESWPQYSRYEGYDAMEMNNFNGINTGFEEDNGRVYNDLLGLGHRISCISTDDNHNRMPDGHEKCDSYGAYTVLKAGELSYASLIDALERGRFYSAAQVNPGAGDPPEIKALWTEDGKICIETSPVRNISYISDARPYKRAAGPIGTTIEGAEFTPGPGTWFRLVVTAMNGNKAYTNAYFMDEVFA